MIRVLVTARSELERAGLAALLASRGHVTVGGGSATLAEARRRVEEEAPQVVLALLDRGAEPPRLVALSGDGIARMELDEPLDVAAAEDEQVEHILRTSRVADCNEPFAHVLGHLAAELAGHRLSDFFPADDPARIKGIRDFVRSRYQLVYSEEEHSLTNGSLRWMSGSASGAVVNGRLRGYWLCLRDTSDRKRVDADRERRGRILEAVAFSAVRLLQPGTWRAQADGVLARLGHAAEAARAWIAEKEEGPDGSASIVFRFAWGAPGAEFSADDPRLDGGVSLRAAGFERFETEMRAGRPIVTAVRDLSEAERAFPLKMGSKTFAAVPVLDGQWWGFLGFGETRYEREWSRPEVEGLKPPPPFSGPPSRESGRTRRFARARNSSGGCRRRPSRGSRSPRPGSSSMRTSSSPG